MATVLDPVAAMNAPAGLMAGAPMTTFKTFLPGDPTYYFGNRIVEELGGLIAQLHPDRVYLVTNPILHKLYGAEVIGSIREAGLECVTVTLEDGEDKKTFASLEWLCEALVARNVSKASVIVGMGGGCLTNVVGLTAGLIFRGIQYVEIPTTMMGITDSCLSNKQAVNGRTGKNQFGMYNAPKFLFGDTHFLSTEPLGAKKAAMVEGVKNGLINDPDHLQAMRRMLSRPLTEFTELDFHEVAERMIKSKLPILKADPTEKHLAMTLEYGHTFGHAMEFLLHGKLPHGFAVAKGMCIAAEIGFRLGYIDQQLLDLHYELFGKVLGLDLTIPEELTPEMMLHSIVTDNKKTHGGTKFVLLKRIGECLNPDGDFQVMVDPVILHSVLSEYKAKHKAQR